MSEIAKRLLEKRANVWNETKGMLDNAASENRDLNAEEQVKYDRLTADLDELRTKADRYIEDEANAKAAEESLRKFAGAQRTPEEAGAAVKLRKFFDKDNRTAVEFESGAEEVRQISRAIEARALSKGTATAGGNTVPTTFYGSLYEYLVEVNTLMREGAEVITTGNGAPIEMPYATSYGAAAAVAEAAVIPQNDPAFAKRTLGAFKFGQLIYVSTELMQDSFFDIEAYLARIAGRNLGLALGPKFITGAGTTEPLGIAVSATTGVTGGVGVAGVPTFDNLIDLFYSVISPYRDQPSAKWLMKDTTAATVRKIKDTTGNYIWQPSVQLGQPDRLLNHAVLTDPSVAGTGLNARSVLFGDLSSYKIRVVNGVRFERSDEFLFSTDQVAFRALIRADGLLMDQTGAVKAFVGGAS